LIGIDQYRDPRIARLRYAGNDVRAMEGVLRQLGFQTITLLNEQATKRNIEAAFDKLNDLDRQDRLVVFFSGHGESVPLPKGSEEGFLIPHDADRSRLVQTGIPMRDIDRLGERLPPKHILFILDACHAGFAFVGFRDIEPEQKGDAYYAAATQKPVVQVLTAGETGQKAMEREGQGVFTRWLVQGLQGAADRDGDGIITANELAAWLEPQVTRDARGQQKPVFGRLFGEGQFLFDLPGRRPQTATPPPPELQVKVVPRLGSLLIRAPKEAVEVWLGDKRLGEATPGADLLAENLPVGGVALRAVARRKGFKPWARTAQVVADARQPVEIDLETLDKVIKGEDGAEMVLIPDGEFWMGSTREEVDRVIAECQRHPSNPTEAQCKQWQEPELPRHQVTLDAFYIDRYEVANALFERFVKATGHRTTAEREGWGFAWRQQDGKWQWLKTDGASWRSPSGSGSSAPADHPVVQVSWEDATAYCRWAGKRLPTEAEWEKAARGTDGRRYPWGETWEPSRANGNMTVKTTTPFGSYPTGASPYGVQDMAGNVLEWVHDWFGPYEGSASRNPTGPSTGQLRVLRGGSWFDYPGLLRSAYRGGSVPSNRLNNLGFRCAQGVE
jgi:formylglycine-generating enzyme required for sulfatase activity